MTIQTRPKLNVLDRICGVLSEAHLDEESAICILQLHHDWRETYSLTYRHLQRVTLFNQVYRALIAACACSLGQRVDSVQV